MRAQQEELIGDLAARQRGLVTRRQLQQAGFSPAAITRRVHSGNLRTLHRGVYLATRLQLPYARELAAVLASGPGAVLSHWSAGALWPVCAARAEPAVHVAVASHRRGCPGICVHRVRLDPVDRTVKDCIPVTTPARTLLDVAALLGARELESAVARAEREGLVTSEAILAVLGRSPRHAGAAVLRAVLNVDGGPALTRSPAEDAFLALVRSGRLPAPECNAPVGRYELDFYWPKARFAVEVDGYGYHSSRASFEADGRRDAALLAMGITVLRLSWRQIAESPILTAIQLAPALARAGVAVRP